MNCDILLWSTDDNATLVSFSSPCICSLFSVSSFVSAENSNSQTYHIENCNVIMNAFCVILLDHFLRILSKIVRAKS